MEVCRISITNRKVIFNQLGGHGRINRRTHPRFAEVRFPQRLEGFLYP